MEVININMDFDVNREDYIAAAMFGVLSYLDEGYKVHFYITTLGDFEITHINKVLEHFSDKVDGLSRANYYDWIKSTKEKVIEYDRDMNNNIPPTIISRLYLYDIFPGIERSITLDDDIACVDSIHKYWTANPDAKIFGVNNFCSSKRKESPIVFGGSWIVNWQWYRDSGMPAKVYKTFKERGIHYDDQLLCLSCPEEVCFSNTRGYNNVIFSFWDEKLYGKIPTVIFHFAGKNKPWGDSPSLFTRLWHINYCNYKQMLEGKPYEVKRYDNNKGYDGFWREQRRL